MGYGWRWRSLGRTSTAAGEGWVRRRFFPLAPRRRVVREEVPRSAADLPSRPSVTGRLGRNAALSGTSSLATIGDRPTGKKRRSRRHNFVRAAVHARRHAGRRPAPSSSPAAVAVHTPTASASPSRAPSPSPGTARRLAVELAPGARGRQRREEVVVLPVLVAEAADGPHEVVRAAGQRAAAAERGGVGRRTAQHPRAVDAADELAPLGELAERRRHGRAARPDELAEDAVRQRERND